MKKSNKTIAIIVAGIVVVAVGVLATDATFFQGRILKKLTVKDVQVQYYNWRNKPVSVVVSSVPSVVVTAVTSQVTSDVTTDITTPVTSKVPSEVTSVVVSEVPSEVVSEVTSEVISTVVSEGGPSQVASNVTSDVPSNVTSNVPSNVTSDVPSSVTSDVTSTVTSDVSSSVTSDVPSAIASAVASPVIGPQYYAGKPDIYKKLPKLTREILKKYAAQDKKNNPSKYRLSQKEKNMLEDLFRQYKRELIKPR